MLKTHLNLGPAAGEAYELGCMQQAFEDANNEQPVRSDALLDLAA